MSPEDVVRALWVAYQRRDWGAARALMDDGAVMTWPCSNERFHGADSIVHVNAVYPEGWTITPLQFGTLRDGRVLSLVRVDLPPKSFFATSLYTLADARIRAIDEYWATAETPPAWRLNGNLPGHELLSPATGQTLPEAR